MHITHTLATLMLVAYANSAAITRSKLGDAICQDGGNAACYVYCKASGHSSGHCVGTEPNENCECSNFNVNDTDTFKCADGQCFQECKLRGNCDGGYCVNEQQCDCVGCHDIDVISCNPARCSMGCTSQGCAAGFCVGTGSNSGCDCVRCNSNTFETDVMKSHKSQISCQAGGRAACIASCKVQGCETGYCEGTAPNETCVCSRCS